MTRDEAIGEVSRAGSWSKDYAHEMVNALEALGLLKLEKPAPSRRADWHYDSQGYCDNPGRGY